MKKITILIVFFFVCLFTMAQQGKKHTVSAGETLSSVAAKYGVSESALKDANPDVNKFFYAGMELVIPAQKALPEEAPSKQVTSPEISSSQTTYISADANQNSVDGDRAGKTKVAMEVLWGYLMPSLGDASDYIENKFSMASSCAFGARYYPANMFYLEGLAGYKGCYVTQKIKGDSYNSNTYSHFITVPLHVGVTLSASDNNPIDLFAGARIDIPLSSKTEYRTDKIKNELQTQAVIDVGLNFNWGSTTALRLQFSYAPSEKNKYTLISIGYCGRF